MKKLLLLSAVALVALSCQNQQTTTPNGADVADTTDSLGEDTAYIDSLGLWEKENLKVNKGYVHLADALWRHRFEDPDLTKDLEWVHQVQNRLAFAFDSVHPNNKTLTAVGKADSMASELHAFLHEDKEEDQFTIMHNMAKDVTFEHYRLLSDYDKLLKVNPAFKTEIEAWNRLEKSLGDFMANAIAVENFGGSIRGVNQIGTYSGLILFRLSSVQALLSGKSCKQSVKADAAKKLLLKAMADRYNALTQWEELEEEQKDDLKAMAVQQKETQAALDVWLNERNKLGVDEANTVKLLEALTDLNKE